MKLSSVVSPQFQESLSLLMKTKHLSAGIMFAIKGIAKKVKEESDKFNEVRNEIINDVAEKDANGKIVQLSDNKIKIAEDKVEEAKKRLAELDAIEIELPSIKIAQLGEKHELSVNDLMALEFIVE